MCAARPARAAELPYNARMERFLDKTALLLGCCALVASSGTAGQGAAAALCLALISSAGAELLLGRGRTVAAGVASTLPCAAALLFPSALSFAPLAIYDLLRIPRTAGAPLAAGILLALLARHGSAATASACLGALGASLSYRTGRIERQTARNRRDRDDIMSRTIALEHKNRDLIDRQGYEIELATLAERARIAREIHDNVGHLLTRAALQIEAIKIVHSKDEGLLGEIEGVGSTLADALETVRRSVHDLHDDAVDLSVQLGEAVRGALAAKGISHDVEVSCDRVPPAVATCFLSITREALSNTVRHSDASHVRVRCLEHPAFYQLAITDNGSAGAPSHTGPGTAAARTGKDAGCQATGMGLISMHERVEALGGTFRAGWREDATGFRVFASVPKPSEQPRIRKGESDENRNRR